MSEPDIQAKYIWELMQDQQRLLWLVETSSVVCYYGDDDDTGGFIVEEREDILHSDSSSGRGVSENWREAIDQARREAV